MHDAALLHARHSLLYVRPGALCTALQRAGDLDDLLEEWVRSGWPVVRRRGDAAEDHVAAGLPLPPSRGKARIALTIALSDVTTVAPPVALAAVRATAPRAWHATIDRLLRLGDHIGAMPRVFGSFAWQALTGLAYVGPGSDLDLLWPLGATADAVMDGLAEIVADAPGAIDGEIVGADGSAVQWRELLAGTSPVLVKHADGVALRPRDAFLEPADA